MPEDVFLIVSAAAGANPTTSMSASNEDGRYRNYFSLNTTSVIWRPSYRARPRLSRCRRYPNRFAVISAFAGAQVADTAWESIDQEDQGSVPAGMLGKRDTCPVV